MTSHMHDAPNPSVGISRWFLFLLVAIIFSGPLLAVLRAPGIGRINTQTHAVERHGAEAEAIRECLQKHGPDMVWVKLDEPVYIFCVDLAKENEALRSPCARGRWGALFALFKPDLECDYQELTAFSPKDGQFHRVTEYLSRFARRLK